MRENRDPVGIFLVSILFFMLYFFGVLSSRERDKLHQKNEEIRYKKEERREYIHHEEHSKL